MVDRILKVTIEEADAIGVANVTMVPKGSPVDPPVVPPPVVVGSIEPTGWRQQFDTTFTKLGALSTLGPDGWYVEPSDLLDLTGKRIDPRIVGNEVEFTIPKGSRAGYDAGTLWRPAAKGITSYYVRFFLRLSDPFFMYGNGTEGPGLKVFYPYAVPSNLIHIISSDMRTRIATQQPLLIGPMGGERWIPAVGDVRGKKWPLGVKQKVEIVVTPTIVKVANNGVLEVEGPLERMDSPIQEWKFAVMFGGGDQAARGDSKVWVSDVYLSAP